ncbi:hypothetical protein B0A49_05487 [Cryomyces minteri]|uniref:Alpha N-terminal protein methyltransferase 1 n=1 Tax=Cryomyces minteri TaxID=331657 RepID=A0A4U0X7Y9_9PEZI|nr:hypothetical protein B0A49_07815 [Cryomyces minteri]TKA77667.1 hypothetical protein B0A49_05487 [Cryomyces minteri]
MADDTSEQSAPSADASIDHAAAIKYWNGVTPTVNGMLGGYPQVSRIDLQGSKTFLAKLRLKSSTHPKTKPLSRVVDCGAGIGRITVEVTDVITEGDDFRELREKGRIGKVYNQGLEDWEPVNTYDLIWNQWCLGQLTDTQLVQYLLRSKTTLTKGGWIVVKENMSTDPAGKDIFDEEDNSVTRHDQSFMRLFSQAGLQVVATELQKGFPKALYPVRIYALQPES